MASEPLKGEQPLLESSSEIDKLVYDLYQIFPDTKITVMGTNFSFREF